MALNRENQLSGFWGRKVSIGFSLAMLMLLVIFAVSSFAQTQMLKKEQPAPKSSLGQGWDTTKPIHITSDKMEADNENRIVHFIGNVVVVQGTAVLNCDLLVIRYKRSSSDQEQENGDSAESNPPDALGAISGASEGKGIETMVAVGRVVLVNEDKKGNSDQATYNFDAKTIHLTGNPELYQGADSLKGDEILIHTDTQQVEVFGTKTKRVNATVMPNTANPAKTGTGQKESGDQQGDQGGDQGKNKARPQSNFGDAF